MVSLFLLTLEQGDTLGSNDFPSSYWTDSFARFCLDGNAVGRYAKQFSNSTGNGLPVRTNRRCLGKNDGVHVDDPIACLLYLLIGQLQHLPGVTVTVDFIRIGKQLANISQSGCSQQGICHGVQQDVSIAVPVGTMGMFDLQPAEDQWSTRHEPMGVVAETHFPSRGWRSSVPWGIRGHTQTC